MSEHVETPLDAQADPSQPNRTYSAARGFSNGKVWERATLDWYQEAPAVTARLLEVEPFTGGVWDPACGGGSTLRACREAGIFAVGTDVVDRGGCPEGSFRGVHDFLSAEPVAPLGGFRVNNILTNPPYGTVEPFLEKALAVANHKVAFLLRTAFLEGKGRRDRIFTKTPIARVWQFSDRISIPPGVSTVKPRGGAVAYAWFVWEHGWQGPPQLGWLA